MKGFFRAGLACFVLIGNLVSAQSIYSFQGLGSLNHQGMPNNVGMGELGIGTPTIWNVNTLNPANLVYNTFSTFQLGVQVDRRNFSGENISGSDLDGGLRFLSYAFPIQPGKWSSSFGILPLSSVSYNTFSEGVVEGDPDVNQFINDRGEGGLTNFFWANGFTIRKKLLVGVKINYTFGSIEKESQITIGGDDIATSTLSYFNQTSYSDINFVFGAAYRHVLSDTHVLNFGLTYSNKETLRGKNLEELRRLSSGGSIIEIRQIANNTRRFDLPRSLGFGVSYQKLNSYKVGIDIETQAWSNSTNEIDTFNNQTKIVLGAEWVPDFDNINSYFRRVRYRVGFSYMQVPYILQDQSINDFGINFGASLPVSGFSSVDLAFKYGQLGTTNNGLIKETYYRIVIGATINDRWFIKRRYQ